MTDTHQIDSDDTGERGADRQREDDTDTRSLDTATRRRFLGTAASAGTLVGIGAAASVGPAVAHPSHEFPTGGAVRVKKVAGGLDSPLAFVNADDGSGRGFAVNKTGVVSVIDLEGGGVTGTFIDVSDRIVVKREAGLLGLAFHPDFSSNRKFYLHYSAPPRSDTPSDFDHTEVLAEFEATDDGSRGLTDSERTVLEIPHPQENHNAGTIAFGPDGYLYMGMGDGGNGDGEGVGDTGEHHVADWYDGNPGGNGQDVDSNLLGSLLRIDVDGREDGKPYAIPDDNPLVGRTGLDEHYAWGFRNPYKFSFDSQGRLFLGDVGQAGYEEVDLVEKGGNYGWNVREGNHCFDPYDRLNPPDSCPTQVNSGPREGEPLRDPIVEYNHNHGKAITGGHVYEEDTVSPITDKYVFGDFTAQELLTTEQADNGSWSIEQIEIENTEDGTVPGNIFGFGLDESGELYVIAGDGIFKIVPTFEARDPDGNGLYEDVNGDEEVDAVDVQRLFAQRDSTVVKNNTSKFDFNGNGEVNIVDVQRLFAELP
jgi:glucose/arabinose dehydrogenase